MAPSVLSKRQCSGGFADDGSCDSSDDDFWLSGTGMGVRYAIVALVFAGLVVLLFLSYLHAQRRLRRGLAPLGYHRWLVSRRQYNPYPPQNNYQHYNNPTQQGYPMNGYYNPQAAPPFQQPPPAYNQWDAPPVYQPPAGASKAMANQHVQGVNETGEGSAGVTAPGRAHHPNNSITQ
ncbi:hypothetical protein MBLNU459_g4333t1 [Dothideomycetes sp. NU459]